MTEHERRQRHGRLQPMEPDIDLGAALFALGLGFVLLLGAWLWSIAQ